LVKSVWFRDIALFRHKSTGFTLAELLVALSVISVIATFNIVKITTAVGNIKNKAICKEAASMVAEAYQKWKVNNVPTSTRPTIEDLMAEINLLGTSTTLNFDSAWSGNSVSCSTTDICYRLHNGAVLSSNKGMRFGGTASLNGILFVIDPDGQASSQKSVGFSLRFNGRLVTYQNSSVVNYVDDQTGLTTFNPGIPDPTWFTWN
jgi:prepilin-type N-terminal cleavage/methylation domain-containing protein